jgi:hypothetical protein
MKQLKHALFILTTLLSLLSTSVLGANSGKWIVVTTINYPSPALKKLAALKDWHLVVVGDEKTPKDWKLDNCVFLSIEDQRSLDYEIIKHLPKNHYSRKNIGYLFAISRGAEVIYETDDDNELIDGIVTLSAEDDLVEISAPGKSAVNVLAYFGQPSVWPRGFPLEHVADSQNYQTKTLSKQRCGVIQGLVDKDPDVDAIFRLTQHREVYFDKKAPAVLPKDVFCPFNTQNTVFSRDAFWGLLIPTTTSFRVCDIWRSYIVQRLLWDADLRLCFTSPTAIQERNQHNLLRDFEDEQDLYLKSGRLIQFLLNWKSEGSNLSDSMIHLTRALVNAGFLGKAEITMLQAWISDLTKLGYRFPDSPIKEGPSVIVSDWHIGTTMWQLAVLKAIGVPVEAYTRSGHRRYASDDPSYREDSLFTNIASWSVETVREEFAKNPRWSDLSHILCSFPPSYITTFEKLPLQVSLLLNMGHRIHIVSSPIEFTKRVIEMKGDRRYTIAAMSEYDFQYTRYYTGIEPLRLPVISEHIPQKLRDAAYAPQNRVVLIGPSHNTNTIIGFDNDLERLNSLSASFAARHGLQPYTFSYIKSVYPNDNATMENLAKHPAVLMNPYSAFSISMVELYHLNIPFFVPADPMLVNAMGDVRLHPLYHDKETVARLEAAYPVAASGYPYSPNDESPDAQRYWLQFMFFNQVKHAQHWTDPEDLFRRLYLNDLSKIHGDMQAENAELFREQLEKWAVLFGNTK